MATKKSASTVFSARPPRRLITVEAVDGWSGAIFAGSIGRKAGYALKCERRIPARPARGRRGSSLSLSFSSHQPLLTGSNVDLITGQTSRESRPGRDFISSPWWRMSGGGCDDKQGGRRGRIGPSPAAESAKSAPIASPPASCRTKRSTASCKNSLDSRLADPRRSPASRV